MVREHTEKVKPPRALFVPFPFGTPSGAPDDPELQHRVLRAALDLLAEPAGPVLRDFPDDAEPGDQPPAPAQASAITPAGDVPDDAALGDRADAPYHEQWLARERRPHRVRAERGAGRRASAASCASSRTSPTGEDADMAERPPRGAAAGLHPLLRGRSRRRSTSRAIWP